MASSLPYDVLCGLHYRLQDVPPLDRRHIREFSNLAGAVELQAGEYPLLANRVSCLYERLGQEAVHVTDIDGVLEGMRADFLRRMLAGFMLYETGFAHKDHVREALVYGLEGSRAYFVRYMTLKGHKVAMKAAH